MCVCRCFRWGHKSTLSQLPWSCRISVNILRQSSLARVCCVCVCYLRYTSHHHARVAFRSIRTSFRLVVSTPTDRSRAGFGRKWVKRHPSCTEFSRESMSGLDASDLWTRPQRFSKNTEWAVAMLQPTHDDLHNSGSRRFKIYLCRISFKCGIWWEHLSER